MSNDDESTNSMPEQQPDYEVGFKKPPKKHHFKPGNNANPKGRPKGARNKRVIVRDILFEPMEVSVDGRIRKVPRLEVVLIQQLKKAMQGDSKAAGEVLRLAERMGLLMASDEQEAPNGVSLSDSEIVKDFMRRVGQQPMSKDET